MSSVPQVVPVHVRWMIRRDLPDVVAIESQVFDFPWSEDDFLAALRERNCIGMVADFNGVVTGYMVYSVRRSRLKINNFAVAHGHRRCGVGSQMVCKLICRLSQQRRRAIVVNVRETNLSAQLFFQAQGFLATGVIRGHYKDSAEDAYTMQYTLNGDGL